MIAAPSLRGLRLLEDVARHADATEREVVDALVAEFVRAARVQPGSVGYVDGEAGAGAATTTTTTTTARTAEIGRRRRRARPSRRYAPPRGTPAWKASRAPRTKTRRTRTRARRTTIGGFTARGFKPRRSLRGGYPRVAASPLLALTRGATDRTGPVAAVGSPTPCARGAARRRRTRARAFARRASRASRLSNRRGDFAIRRSPENASPGLSGGRDGMIQRAIGDLPPSVFAVVVRAVTAALAGHFARADIVRSAVRSALGTAPRRRRRRRRPRTKKKNDDDAFGTRTDECARAACAALPAGERAAASAAASDAVLALTDAAQGAVARAIASNAAATRSTLAEFSNVCRAADDFLERAERLGGGRRCLALRATVAAQCKDLFAARHAAFAAKLGVVLEAETWTAVTPVPPEFQRVLDGVASLAEGKSRGREAVTRRHARAASRARVQNALVFPNTGERVVPVGASLALLKMLRDHVAAAARFPSLAPTAVHKTAELLRVFNSRTSQLVLGAGAMRTAGLRSITAKHLALATESVRLFALVAPLVSAALAPAFPSRGAAGYSPSSTGPSRTSRRTRGSCTPRRWESCGTGWRTTRRGCPRFGVRGSSPSAERAGSSGAGKEEDEGEGEIEDADGAKGPSEFATALGKEIGTLRRVVAGTLCARDAAAVFDEVLAHFDECATETLRDARRLVAKEWRAKMGDRGEGDRGRGGCRRGGCRGGCRGGAERGRRRVDVEEAAEGRGGARVDCVGRRGAVGVSRDARERRRGRGRRGRGACAREVSVGALGKSII